MMGAAPVPVPLPIPAVMNTILVPSFSIFLMSSMLFLLRFVARHGRFPAPGLLFQAVTSRARESRTSRRRGGVLTCAGFQQDRLPMTEGGPLSPPFRRRNGDPLRAGGQGAAPRGTVRARPPKAGTHYPRVPRPAKLGASSLTKNAPFVPAQTERGRVRISCGVRRAPPSGGNRRGEGDDDLSQIALQAVDGCLPWRRWWRKVLYWSHIWI